MLKVTADKNALSNALPLTYLLFMQSRGALILFVFELFLFLHCELHGEQSDCQNVITILMPFNLAEFN